MSRAPKPRGGGTKRTDYGADSPLQTARQELHQTSSAPRARLISAARFSVSAQELTSPRQRTAPSFGTSSPLAFATAHRKNWPFSAVDRARENLGPVLADRVLLGDFFTHDFAATLFDVTYERTFFCALPPDLRPQYIERMARLLTPGGVLVGLFYLGEEQGGPPYQLHAADEARLFGAHFVLVQDQPAAEPFPLFGDNERWREYRRIK